MPHPRSPSACHSREPTNREMINKIDNDISLLRGEVMELKVLLTKLLETKKKESSGWIFS